MAEGHEMTIDPPAAAPDRIATLDVIRGVAVMGILIMNIAAFAMPEAAYTNPAAYGGHSGIDLAVWAFNFVFIDGKMRGLFSFLFGASMLLVDFRNCRPRPLSVSSRGRIRRSPHRGQYSVSTPWAHVGQGHAIQEGPADS